MKAGGGQSAAPFSMRIFRQMPEETEIRCTFQIMIHEKKRPKTLQNNNTHIKIKRIWAEKYMREKHDFYSYQFHLYVSLAIKISYI